MNKPANPAIIIGLGGTGQWVLTYVKKNLIDTYGQVPPTVKLLSFDTTSEKTEAKVEKGEEHARVGNIQLDPGEFIYLGGNVHDISSEIKREHKHPHISSWFQANYYLETMDRDAFELAKGAGQRRPFGRMSIFYDLTTNPSQITGKLEQAITEVKTQNEKNQPIEIYIVCSLAGGTGSGMVIDIAHIVRKMAETVRVPFAVRGFLVLQNTFNPVIDLNHILANSFAAIRELDRFLQVFDRDYPIYYADDKTNRDPKEVYRSLYKSKLFDNCYLLDARRKNLPLDGVKPWLGVFPAAAECISALLDPETGDAFAQHYKNVNTRLAEQQKKLGQTLYSSLGTYTYILPIVDITETLTHKAALELLGEKLFKISTDPHTGDQRVSADNQQELRSPPRDEAMNFFKTDKTATGTQNLPFFQQMALQIEGGSLENREYIAQMASYGLELLSWLKSVETDQSINLISENIQGILEASLRTEILSSEIEKDDWHSAADRIVRQITEFRHKKLGYEESNGRRIPGELQKGLAEYAYRNRKRFRAILSEKLTTILNGESSDPQIAKAGKLPYGQEFLSYMLRALDEFDGYMKRVWGYRADGGEVGVARDDSSRTKQIMNDTRDLTGFFDKLQKTAVHAQEDYINAEDFLFSIEREDVLYRAIMDYTSMFRVIVQDAKAQLDAWAQALTLGGEINSGEQGAYNLLSQQLADIKRRRDEQNQIRVYKYLTDEPYETGLYKSNMDEKWNEVLRRFKWEFAFAHDESAQPPTAEEGQLQYRYRWEKDKETDFIARFYYDKEQLAQTKSRQSPASILNARFLADKLRPYFADVRNETVADRLDEHIRADGLAKEMLDYAGALIDYSAEKQAATEKHNFVCVNKGIRTDYFSELTDSLQRQAPSDKDNQVIGLTNKHRCIVLSTTDLIIGQETSPIITSRDVYMKHTGDHRLLHNFPAEVNASGYEARIPKPPINEARRLLSPTLVALLEDRDMMRRYVLAQVFGLMREELALDDPQKNQFVLRLDRRERRDDQSLIRLTSPDAKPNELDAMTNFVFVKIDADSGTRYIQDITPGLNIQVEPRRVDDAIELRQKAFLNGRDVIVQEFDRFLSDNLTLLNAENAQARAILVNAFRKFMMADYDRYDRDLKLGNTETLATYITTFLDNNRDCLVKDEDNVRGEALHKKLGERILDLLKEADGRIKPQPLSALVKLLENHIDNTLVPMRKASPLDESAEAKLRRDMSNVMIDLRRDIGSIMHLILWDEIERLERQAS